jgi:hypothetical protein
MVIRTVPFVVVRRGAWTGRAPPGEGQLSIGLGGQEWVDAAVSGAIGLVAVPPVLLGTAYGIWKENRLDQVIDERVGSGEPFHSPER